MLDISVEITLWKTFKILPIKVYIIKATILLNTEY